MKKHENREDHENRENLAKRENAKGIDVEDRSSTLDVKLAQTMSCRGPVPDIDSFSIFAFGSNFGYVGFRDLRDLHGFHDVS